MTFCSFRLTGGRVVQIMEKAKLSIILKEVDYFYYEQHFTMDNIFTMELDH